jgi:hypothetical protein
MAKEDLIWNNNGCFHGTCDKKTQHSLNRLKLSGLMY